MKRLLCLLLLGLAGAATAQVDADAERDRISAERARVEAAFIEREKACYGKFAVNDCIDAARALRREAVADLRRQEILLNDAQRKRKADERLRELEERKAEQARRPASAAAPQAGPAPAPAAPRPARPAQPSPRKEPAASTPPAPDTRDNLRRYQARIEEAQERKGKVEQRAAERKKPVRPLPVPP